MPFDKTQNIICYGEVLWDMLPTGAKPGGAPLNVAIHLQKQGQRPVLISAIGNDEDGRSLLQFLNQSGLQTSFIQTDKQLPTSTVLVNLDENKNATYKICEPVAWDNIQYQPEFDQLANYTNIIIYGSLASRNETTLNTLLQLCEKSDAQRFMDVNLRPPYNTQSRVEQLLHLSNFVKLNDEELEEISGWHSVNGDEKKLAKWFINHYNCETLCITRGAKGASLFVNGKFYEHNGFVVKAVDTVGAGDSFFASLIACLLKNIPPAEALETACATGAFVASQKGAVPGYSEKDIEKIKNSRL